MSVKAIAGMVLGLFLSLKTSVVIMLGLIMFFVAGALIMPVSEAFQSINSMPMFRWLRQAPAADTWWLLGSIVLLGALALNTVACSVEALLRKRQGRRWLLIIAPQIIHIGFLLMMLGHLVSASGGMRGTAVAIEGMNIRLPDRLVLKVTEINIRLGPTGHPADWRASIEYSRDGNKLRDDYMAPNRPSFFEGYGVYLKQVRAAPMKAALIEVTREPGAPWALGGGLVFIVGNTVLVGLKMSREK